MAAIEITVPMMVGLTGCSAVAATVWAISLSAAAAEFGVATEARLPHFLAQCAHESRQFTRVVESMNYTPKRMREVWPSRFPTLEFAAQFVDAMGRTKQAALANYVYAGRGGNGPAASGDGWRFIGRTPIMVTTRDNYVETKRRTGIECVLHPEVLERAIEGSRGAASYFAARCGAAADRGDSAGVVRGIQPGAGRDELAKRIAMSDAAVKAMGAMA